MVTFPTATIACIAVASEADDYVRHIFRWRNHRIAGNPACPTSQLRVPMLGCLVVEGNVALPPWINLSIKRSFFHETTTFCPNPR